MGKTKYTHRFLARFVIEAKTPLAIGNGEKDIPTDALVAADVNGLPYIPGTAIAGVVRHMLKEVGDNSADEYGRTFIDKLFGYQETREQKEIRLKTQKQRNEKQEDLSQGSEIIFTEAKILNSKGEVIDGMNLKTKDDELLKHYDELPIRQHVRINEKGVTDKTGKFDEQVVFAGTRFCFELEMFAENDTIDKFNKILEQIQSKSFRIGSGTRSGFGEIKVVDLQDRTLDLTKSEDRSLYLSKSSKMSDAWSGWEQREKKTIAANGWTTYKLVLQPEDFFLFGSGFGDEDVDMTPVKEAKVDWSTGKGVLEENLVLIPATSVKGALSHRTAFHWNRLNHYYAGSAEAKVGKDNPAVLALFGFEGDNENDQVRGNVLFSDVIEKKLSDKIFNHVAIDRFTGGAIDGALFSEKTTYGKGESFEMTILVKEKAFKEGEQIQAAFEDALKDICKGLLPLGGGVNRGNGVFTGSLTKDGKEISL